MTSSANSTASNSDMGVVVVERFSTYHAGTAETRGLFQHDNAHDRECSSHGNLPREIRLPSRISKVHPCEKDRENLKVAQSKL
jgi:hypothetical protein